MRIDWLRVESFKNLQGFVIDLAEHEAMSVLIGENGAGKSNLFEAIVLIFRWMDLDGRDERVRFAFELRYECRGKKITVTGHPDWEGQGYRVSVDGKELSQRAFRAQREALLPAHIFAYYSGPGDRLERLFRRHLRDFDKRVRDKKLDVGELRRFFFCLPRHSRYVLLAYFLEDARHREFLKDYFGIEAFDSALLVLKRPWWSKPGRENPEGNALFWGALGNVSRFLDVLWTHALAPMRITEPADDDALPGEQRRSDREIDRHYLYLPSEAKLRAVAKEWDTPKKLFAALDAIDLADLVDDVRVSVRCGGETDITFSELSEGEQQLLTVVGMLRFTQGEETLFLLDEPDTHLNPRWKLDYLELLQRELDHVSETSQLLLSTHDPLTIASLEKKQVQIFQRDRETRRVSVHEATEDPRGLGVAGVLTQMFGLPRTLDRPTLEMMDKRAALAAKAKLTDEEQRTLDALNKTLGALGFLYESRDPRVGQVLAAIADWERECDALFWKLDENEQRALAVRLVRERLGAPSAGGTL